MKGARVFSEKRKTAGGGDAWNGSTVSGVVRRWLATKDGSAICLVLSFAYVMTFVALGSKRGETLRIQVRLRGQASGTR